MFTRWSSSSCLQLALTWITFVTTDLHKALYYAKLHGMVETRSLGSCLQLTLTCMHAATTHCAVLHGMGITKSLRGCWQVALTFMQTTMLLCD